MQGSAPPQLPMHRRLRGGGSKGPQFPITSPGIAAQGTVVGVSAPADEERAVGDEGREHRTFCFTPSLGSPSRHGQFSVGNVTSEVTSCAHAEMRRWRLGEMMRLSCLHQASASCQHWLCGAVCRAPGRMSPAVSCRRRTPWFRKHSGTDHRSSSEEARSCLGHLHSAESLL